ncbi:MAG: SEC-C domain-containing protein [SAR324 cluster bacterium]|nr:SEC-C domain-containing protein [SAR324 cluster bacterium]
MTLIISVLTKGFVVQVSDRRLSANNRLIEDDSNKAGIFQCVDGFFIYGLSGLARAYGHETNEWTQQALIDSAKDRPTTHATFEKFQRVLTDRFSNHPGIGRVSPSHKRTTIVFSGFVLQPEMTKPFMYVFSNFEDPVKGTRQQAAGSNFSMTAFSPNTPDSSMIYAFGNWPAITAGGLQRLNKLVLEGNSKPIKQKALDLILKAADADQANTIGKNISIVELSAKLPVAPICSIHAGHNRNDMFFPDQVIAFGRNRNLITKDMKIDSNADQSSLPIFVPKVNRNAPCPCGSGKKYKRCRSK